MTNDASPLYRAYYYPDKGITIEQKLVELLDWYQEEYGRPARRVLMNSRQITTLVPPGVTVKYYPHIPRNAFYLTSEEDHGQAAAEWVS